MTAHKQYFKKTHFFIVLLSVLIVTGIGNRRAYISFEDEHKDICPFGYVMCDINALKKTNDTFCHDKGDELIKNVTDKLVNIFGSWKVFRVGGDEFVAYSFEETEEGFNSQIIRARKALSDKDCSASIGGVYSMLKPDNLGAIKKKSRRHHVRRKRPLLHNQRRAPKKINSGSDLSRCLSYFYPSNLSISMIGMGLEYL